MEFASHRKYHYTTTTLFSYCIYPLDGSLGVNYLCMCIGAGKALSTELLSNCNENHMSGALRDPGYSSHHELGS